MEVKRINIGQLTGNTGQIEGLPANPRTWTQTEIDRLAKSLKETPELFEMRPLLVYQQGEEYVILGGNLRYEGAKKNKMQDCPAIVIPADTPVEKLKEIVIKDNGSFGEWDVDALANEWDDLPLDDWGVNMSWDKPKESKASDKDLSNDIESSFRVEIQCASEGEQEMIYSEMTGRGFECRILTL
jgi:hypothetical protein